MRKQLAALPAIVVSLVVILAAPAWGHTQTRLDPDDTPGPLDIVAARHSHRSTDSGVLLRFRVVTYETWTFPEDHPRILVEFELPSEFAIERCVVIARRWVDPGEFRVEGHVYRDCDYLADERIGTAKSVTRPDDHSLTVTLAKRLLGKNVRSYRWRVVTGYQDEESADCQPKVTPPGEPHPDGGYPHACTDFTRWTKHSF